MDALHGAGRLNSSLLVAVGRRHKVCARFCNNRTELAGAAGLVRSDHVCLRNASSRKLAVGVEVLQQPFNLCPIVMRQLKAEVALCPEPHEVASSPLC